MPIRQRGKFIADNPIIGSQGTQFGKMLFGSACINCASMIGDGEAVGTVAVTNAASTDNVIVVPSASLQTGAVLYSACVTSGCISASFLNSGSADISASADVTVSYIIFS